jgi:hypothetical protein
MPKPVIFLAFADSRRDLPALQEERRALDDLLASDFNVEQKDAATQERIEQTFRSYGKAVRVFHFAGHADADRLHLVAGKKGHEQAYVQGIAKYVGQQQGVELVFLNGCSTKGQVEYFKAAGIPAVIATTAPVNDQVAREFAELFYANFVQGKGRNSLQEAFDDATAQLESRYESYSQLYSRALGVSETHFETEFPYELHLRNLQAGQTCYQDLLLPDDGEAPEKVPPQAHLLLNRDDPNEVFEEQIKEALMAPERRPIICLVHGEERELPLKLCQRFREITVKETFKALDQVLNESRLEVAAVEMPRKKDYKRPGKALNRIKESLKVGLELEEVSAREITGLTGQKVVDLLPTQLEVVLLQHNLYAEEWDAQKTPALLEEYLGQFWDLTLPEAKPEILLLFSLQYPPKKGLLGRWQKPDLKLSQEFADFAEVLDLLESVRRLDLKKWNDKYASDDPGLTDRIFAKDKPLPMEVILPQLEAIVKKYRAH